VPDWRFAFTEDASGPSAAFDNDVARLFPR
jgi:hypothetical protein